jgi:hypothetical protein
MPYSHKLSVESLPVPKDYIRVVIETDVGTHITSKELYATPEDFLEFWKPLVDYYKGLKNANSIKNG